jgi:uncharacterized integral membrane protein
MAGMLLKELIPLGLVMLGAILIALLLAWLILHGLIFLMKRPTQSQSRELNALSLNLGQKPQS